MAATTAAAPNAAATPAPVPLSSAAVRAFAAASATGALEATTIQRRELQADDVSIRVHYCGICHTDLHMLKNEWGRTTYPLTPGHEIIGEVEAVGSGVRRFAVGQRVGVGCMVGSCGQCGRCTADCQQHCTGAGGFVRTYGSPDRLSGGTTKGGYSERIVVAEAFVLSIPASLDAAAAAPLLCAGITSYSPLVDAGVKAGSAVGIVGIGGLGHLGLKLAKAMGAARVVAFTSKAAKRDELLALGADDVVVTSDAADVARVADSLDVIVDSVSAEHDLAGLLGALRWGGRLTVIGAPPAYRVPPFPLLMKNLELRGSFIGGIARTQQLLDLCGEKNITAIIELVPLADVNKALERLEKGDVRYRFVLDVKGHYEGAAAATA